MYHEDFQELKEILYINDLHKLPNNMYYPLKTHKVNGFDSLRIAMKVIPS